MILGEKSKSRSSVLETYSLYFVIAWTIIVGGFLLFGVFQIRHIQQEMVKNEARANFNKDQALRFWSATHGGVYVPATEETPPNPHLSHVKERDIKTPDGKALTLMNPAYMLRQTMEKYESLYGVRGHITSLKHFRPETAPDEWEKFALQEFERGAKEISEFIEMDGKPYYRYMSPMITKPGCLKCHGHQGYKVGDVRGGVSVTVPMTPYLTNQQRQTITLAVSLGLLWLLGFTGLVWANRGLKNRARERDRAETKLQKSHDRLEQRTAELTHEIEKHKRTEEELEKHRDHMGEMVKERTAELDKRISEGKQLNKAMVNLLEDLRTANETLEETTRQLEDANKELESFSYSVSHDLRAPLRAIDGFARMLEEDYGDRLDREGQRQLDVIQKSTQEMGQLIEDLLAFSRLSRKAMNMSDINMVQLAEEVFEQLRRNAPGQGARLNIRVLPPAHGDRAMIHSVFTNLLSNALKFTEPVAAAAIEVSGTVEGDECIWSVKDNGVGFDMKYADKLFQVFQRLHSTKEIEGTGVGLALVQRIISRHGGRVWAEGKVNEGATFYFSLPRG